MEKVDWDLNIKLCFNEVTVLDQQFSNIEQYFLLTVIVLLPACSVVGKFSPVFTQVLNWRINGFAVWRVRHGDLLWYKIYAERLNKEPDVGV